MPIIDPYLYSDLSKYALLTGDSITATDSVEVYNSSWGGPNPANISINIVSGRGTGQSDFANYNYANDDLDLVKAYLKTYMVTYPNYTGETTNRTFTPGVYRSNSAIVFDADITLTLDGSAGDLFIFIAETSITFRGPVNIELINGASAENVVWLADTGFITFTAPVTDFNTYGIFIANQNVSFAGSVNLIGRVFTQLGSINFDGTSAVTVQQARAPCFNKGTQILTEDGYKSVELLKVGDMIQTFGDIDKETVTLRDSTFQKCMFIKKTTVPSSTKENGLICFKAGSLGDNLPEQDLYVSPNHGMVVGDRLKAAKYLVTGTKIFHSLRKQEIHYYHIELETHSCVKANGALTESFLR